MKTLTSLLAIVFLAGCAQLQPGADPFIVRVEQTQQIAFDTFDTFVTMDHNNRELFKKRFPDAHTAAEWLRATVVRRDGKTMQRGLSILTDLKAAKTLYKTVPNAANKTDLTIKLARVESALSTVQEQMTAVKGN